MEPKQNLIRNFAIIAHIDHGKSTLADRILDHTGLSNTRVKQDRILDTLELEQERGITIKLQTARMDYEYTGNNEMLRIKSPYILNMIDTPGHVDFSYEVSRSLAAAQGALLLVDATQGIQAQTLTTLYKAIEGDLEIIPVLNKIDLPNADVEAYKKELNHVFGFEEDEIILTSGKTGEGVTELLNRIIEKIPPPIIDEKKSTEALIFDSFYHEYKGVVALIALHSGSIEHGDEISIIGSKTTLEPVEIGYLNPHLNPSKRIHSGEVGYIATGIKDIKKIHVGDTVTSAEAFKKNLVEPLPGYRPPKPMVYAAMFPIDHEDFRSFQEALEKLALNDSALTSSKIHSQALGSGFLCGFLGLLHLEITEERLEREFDLDLLITSPTVEYKLHLLTNDLSKLPNMNIANFESDYLVNIRSAAEYPDPSLIKKIDEPWIKVEIITPENYIGSLMDLSQKFRGIYKDMKYISNTKIKGEKHVTLSYEFPTAEIIINYFDQLKSVSQGYASMDYEFIEFRESDVVKVKIMVNYEEVEALSFLSHKSNAEQKGRKMVSRLKELIPRQQFKIPIQAAINNNVIARETIAAYRKDVTAKLYGGDITRKKKLLSKQKKGKKRMKQFGNIELPKSVFIDALKN